MRLEKFAEERRMSKSLVLVPKKSGQVTEETFGWTLSARCSPKSPAVSELVRSVVRAANKQRKMKIRVQIGSVWNGFW